MKRKKRKDQIRKQDFILGAFYDSFTTYSFQGLMMPSFTKGTYWRTPAHKEMYTTMIDLVIIRLSEQLWPSRLNGRAVTEQVGAGIMEPLHAHSLRWITLQQLQHRPLERPQAPLQTVGHLFFPRERHFSSQLLYNLQAYIPCSSN
jgi:hypothetical protein